MSTVAICSGKGSPGATFVATNLAAAMTRLKRDVLLLDLDPAGGDVSCYLRLDFRKGLYPLLRTDGIPTEPERLLAEAEERSHFLAISGLPTACDAGSQDMLPTVVRTARSSGRTVVADIGRVSEANAPLASEADLVALVVRPDLVSVVGAERAIRCLNGRVVSPQRLVVIVSGLERRRPGDVAEIADALRVPVIGSVPLDRRGAQKALFRQVPASTRKLRRAFRDLATVVQQCLYQFASPMPRQYPNLVGTAT
jgi:Flp pilus assembly CpaE family ATPase